VVHRVWKEAGLKPHRIERYLASDDPDFESKAADIIERTPAREVHIILDNLSAHKSQVVRDFLATHLNVHFHFTPTYSSWLNQVEIWFSKVERDVIAREIFTSVKDLARKLRRYINAYSANAKPIQWRYSDPTRRIRSNLVSATCH
jgi:transposase